jgi:hypothetical protein
VRGLWSQFGPNVVLAALVLVVSLVAGGIVWATRRRRGREVLRPVCRLLAFGSAAVIVAATVGFRGVDVVPGHADFILGLGDGGLRWAGTDLRDFPNTVQSILLVGNVALYVPLGLFGALGSPVGGRVWVFLACFALSPTIELLQATVLSGGGATDDVVLNVSGLAVGWVCGLGLERLRR